jgi:hypothetical protein
MEASRNEATVGPQTSVAVPCRFTEFVKSLSLVDDYDPRNFGTRVGQELGGTIGSHLIWTGGDWHIKSEDPVPTDTLTPGNSSVSIEEENADRG